VVTVRLGRDREPSCAVSSSTGASRCPA